MTPRSLGGGGAAPANRDSRARAHEAEVAFARSPEPCARCREIQRDMIDGLSLPGERVCAVCGADYLYRAPGSKPRARAPRPIGIGPREELRVTTFVRELLALHLAQARAESTTASGKFLVQRGESSTASAIRAAQTGIVGSGCSGTRGAWGGAPQEPRELPVVPVEEASERRYRMLSGEARETALAIVADAQGDRVAPVDVAGKTHALTLEQRLGLRLADALTQRRWLKHAGNRDTGPMLLGSAELGAKRLREASEAWWGA